MQEHHDLLPVLGRLRRGAHDQRRGQKLHLLDRNVRMHPVRPGARGEVVGARFARGQRGHRHVRHPVLHIRGNLAVPVDDRRHVERVGQIDAEALAWVEDQALAGRADQPVDGRRAAVDVQDPACRPEGKGGGVFSPCGKGKMRKAQRRGACGQKAASGKGGHRRLLGTGRPVRSGKWGRSCPARIRKDDPRAAVRQGRVCHPPKAAPRPAADQGAKARAAPSPGLPAGRRGRPRRQARMTGHGPLRRHVPGSSRGARLRYGRCQSGRQWGMRRHGPPAASHLRRSWRRHGPPRPRPKR